MEETSAIKYTIPSYVQKLFRVFERAEKKAEKGFGVENKIEIGESISKLAFFYEKIRNAIDYKEEHLLRKNAILRILKRRFIPGVDTKEIAEPLIKELILGGYVKNRSLPESKIQEVNLIIDKFASLINRVYFIHNRKSKKNIFNWLICLCACEIEEHLAFQATEHALINFMYHTLNERIIFKGSNAHTNIRDIQIYIAILKNLVRFDADMISYNIFKYYYQEWHTLSAPQLENIALHIFKIKFKIELQQEHVLGEQINKVVRKYIPIFSVLRDVITKNYTEAFDLIQNPTKLEKAIKEACKEKYKEVRTKLKRTSVRSIIYIFLTKMMVALILEIPYELFIANEKLNYLPLGINVIFHPMLLFIIALIIRVPSDENTKKISDNIKDIIYDYPGKNIKHFIRPPIVRGWFISGLFQFLYTIAFVTTFGGIIFVLYVLHFNIIGMILFILFLSLVTFFGLKVRQAATELLVSDKKPGIFSLIINFFAVPIIRAGRWMSVKFSKINFFVFFFDFIIEAPFKLLVDVFEDWSTYIREKKEEIYDKD